MKRFGVRLVALAIYSSVTFAAAGLPNQPSLVAALQQCDADMVAMLYQRGGVSADTEEARHAALWGVFDGAGSDAKKVAGCLTGFALTMRHGGQAMAVYTARGSDVLAQLAHWAGQANSGSPGADAARLKSPISWPKRVDAVLQVLKEQGLDPHAPQRPVYKGRVTKYTPAPEFETKNFLMKLAATPGVHAAARHYVSKENIYAGAIQVFLSAMQTSDVNATNSSGKTALMFAAASPGAPYDTTVAPLIQVLLEGGADKHIKDKAGKTALDYALARGDTQAAKLLY